MTIDEKASAILTFKDMLDFSEKYSKEEIKAINAGIEVLNFFTCEDAISRRAMIMTTCANCSERICPFRDGGADPSTACAYVQRIKALKPVIPLLTAKEPKRDKAEENIKKYRPGENLKVYFMLESDLGGQGNGIIMRIIATDEKGETTKQDILLSTEAAKAFRKGLKLQIMRNKGIEPYPGREGDD